VSAGLLAARLVLAAVFCASAVPKFGDHTGTRATAAAFGVPSRLTGSVALALPVAELLVAAALIPASTAALAGWAALALLTVFSVAVVVSLARGRRPDCHCFGQFSAVPIGWRTLARNAVLAGLAGFVAIGGWPDGGTSLGELGATRAAVLGAAAALTLAVVVDAAVVVQQLGWRGRARDRRDEPAPGTAAPAGAAFRDTAFRDMALPGTGAAAGLPVGAAAPEFQVARADGTPMTLAGLRSAGRPVLLVFGDPDCGSCQSLMPDVASWQAEHSEQFTAALISRAALVAGAAQPDRYHLAHLGVQRDREVALAYAYAGTPSAVAVSADGRIASRMVSGPDGVRALAAALLAWAAAGVAAPAGAATGNPA
jgi:hypothetical protein